MHAARIRFFDSSFVEHSDDGSNRPFGHELVRLVDIFQSQSVGVNVLDINLASHVIFDNAREFRAALYT